MTATTKTPEPPAITPAGGDAADLADLLGRLREWIEEDQPQPLPDRHDHDINGLRVRLDRHTVLLTPDDRADS